jgi:hypothetical protein
MITKNKIKKSLLLSLNFYGSIIITLILHYFLIQNFNWGSTSKVAFDFLIFNLFFGVTNIICKFNFKKI